MSSILPVVRYLILCDDVQTDPAKANRVTLVGLVGAIRSPSPANDPIFHEELCVFVQLTECRGPGQGWIEIQNADTGELVFRTPQRLLAFGDDPLGVYGAVFRLKNLLFPGPGLYWFQFWYNHEMLEQQPLLVR